MAGIGPATSPLPRECSTTEPHGRYPEPHADNHRAANPAVPLQSRIATISYRYNSSVARRAPVNRNETGINCSGAGEGNRTLVVSLEGFCSTIELHPRNLPPRQPIIQTPAQQKLLYCNGSTPESWWRGTDSNHRTRKRADLQSAAFNHSATHP